MQPRSRRPSKKCRSPRRPAGRRDRRSDRRVEARGRRAAEGARLRSVRRGGVPHEQRRPRRRRARLFDPMEGWKAILDTNLWGVINGVQVFGPGMARRRSPGAIVNTGSKQGITCPPGNTAYNVSKAGVKVVTEALAHELRNIAGLPGDGASARAGLHLHRHHGRRPEGGEAGRRVDGGAGRRLHAAGAGEGRVLHPLPRQRGDAPDGREAHALGDGRLVQNRPALSRWHPDYKDAFAKYMAE